jgi:hypothetical protein
MSSGYYVSDEFRTNHLSLKPGGSMVKVNYRDLSFRVYDKIKYPQAYINKITVGDPAIVSVEVDGKLVWQRGS